MLKIMRSIFSTVSIIIINDCRKYIFHVSISKKEFCWKAEQSWIFSTARRKALRYSSIQPTASSGRYKHPQKIHHEPNVLQHQELHFLGNLYYSPIILFQDWSWRVIAWRQSSVNISWIQLFIILST